MLDDDCDSYDDDFDKYADLVVCKLYGIDRSERSYAERKASMKAALRFASDHFDCEKSDA